VRCPKCAQDKDKVVDSRTLEEGGAIRRRRVCLACGHRFTTYERVAAPALMVLKRDQRREAFDSAKLQRSIAYAVAKRPVPPQQVEAMVADIRREVEEESGADALVPSTVIGRKVLLRLEKLDEVAYLRYVSIYRRFRDAAQFFSEIENLIGRN
jgi:transcriptional repressor NrdR